MSFGTWLYGGLSLLWGLDALRLRGRASALHVLAPTDEAPDPALRFIIRPGVQLDEATQRAASAWVRSQNLSALDLIPADAPARRQLFLLQLIDFARFRAAPLAKAFSAGSAMVVRQDLLTRMGEPNPLPTTTPEFMRLARHIKQYAPQGLDYALAPGLQAASEKVADEREVVRMAIDDVAFPIVYLQLFLALLGPIFVGPMGWLALVLIQLQALIATGGTALHPADLIAHSWLRVPLDIAGLSGWGAEPSPASTAIEALRPAYTQSLSAGTEPFFEPRRQECPFCSSTDLRARISTGDLFQGKPGRFVLEECGGCRLVFQNPRLSIQGLDFYYRDFYDGLGEARLEGIFVSTAEPYDLRAKSLRGVIASDPERWLDVGTGHGHFCLVARQQWPSTHFEGLDLSSSVEEAERRGWVEQAHRGLFPELADSLSQRFDVVSMSHYLEHTRDPKAEIAAAAKVLKPGGALMIELPDPESKFGGLLGRFWMPWFQPQHQYLMSPALVESALQANGFEAKQWEFGPAHLPVDLVSATYLRLQDLTPDPGMPWTRPATAWDRFLHRALWIAAMPALLAAYGLDHALLPATRKRGWSNAFRVVAVLGPSATGAQQAR